MRYLETYKLFENVKFDSIKDFAIFIDDNNISNVDFILDTIKSNNLDITETWRDINNEDRNILWHTPCKIVYYDEDFIEGLMDINPNIYDVFIEMIEDNTTTYQEKQSLNNILSRLKKLPKYEYYFDADDLGII